MGVVASGFVKEAPIDVILEPVFYRKGSLDIALSKSILYPLPWLLGWVLGQFLHQGRVPIPL